MLIYNFLIVSFLVVGCTSPDKQSGVGDPQQPDTTAVTHYTNPVFEPILADPSVIRDAESGYFYAYGLQLLNIVALIRRANAFLSALSAIKNSSLHCWIKDLF